ncbi:MAG: squalene/phytoene synthase family protein [Myxococcaceae bacterium]|jgi:farnesyl-diphosphate farnesyltransferase|nr:squalene/phytoene synthase family protein [Myxococcaceae bacterium]MCA3014649.1 squalene/phytoene synthase family protein [Myxococcaceae bacterium]
MTPRPDDDVEPAHGPLEHLLTRTSRTFALVIPRLPEPTRGAVTVAYLLLRLADTVEDSAGWPVAQRRAALEALAKALETRRADVEALAGSWRALGVTRDDGCLELLSSAGVVVRALERLSPGHEGLVREHVARSVRGMGELLAGAPERGHQLSSLSELRAYCYVVAGLVGELLTALFRADAPSLEAVADRLSARAVAFGEGLQLVNVLKDEAVDEREGRRFIPRAVSRQALVGLARADLAQAREYVAALREGGAPEGVVAFAWLPVELAVATLERLEAQGAGAKLSRDEVFALVAAVDAQLAAGRAAGVAGAEGAGATNR